MSYEIFPAVELQEIDVPIERVVNADGSLNIREEVKKYFDIDYKPKLSALRLIAGGRIGLIPLNDHIAVNVKPKFPISNLIYIISKSGEELNTLDFFRRHYAADESGDDSLFLFFAKSLAKELEALSTEGVYREYMAREASMSSPKGHFKIGRTLAKNWSRGNYSHMVVEHFAFTADTALNRLIKFAIWKCLMQLSLESAANKIVLERLSYFYNLLEEVPVDMSRGFVERTDRILALDKIPALRAYYINLARLSKFIVNGVSVSFSSPEEDVQMLTFCIHMPDIFEKYILNFLRSGRARIADDVAILDGNNDGKKALFNDRETPEAKPDFVVRVDGKNRIIIDAKYKVSLHEVDRYQIISHCLSYDVNVAVLLSPCSSAAQSGLKAYGTIGGEYQIVIYEYYFHLGSTDLPLEESSLLDSIATLLTQH